jgi:hypothetical protein
MSTPTNPNRVLADQARQHARSSPASSLDRRAWGCCAVVLQTTRSIAAARAALADVHDPVVQATACRYLDNLNREG